MANASTHIFRVSLKPRLYREIEIDSGKSLYDLAEAIVRAFDFDLDHAFGFFSELGHHVFDSAVRRGVESPWERIRALKSRTTTPLEPAHRQLHRVPSPI